MDKGRHVRMERRLAFDRRSSNAELISQLMLHETCREPAVGPGRGPEPKEDTQSVLQAPGNPRVNGSYAVAPTWRFQMWCSDPADLASQ